MELADPPEGSSCKCLAGAARRAKGGGSMQEAAEVLRGCRVLIVEDEMLVAMDLEALIEEQGCAVIGPAPTVDRALALLQEERPDVAILDVNLNGESAAPVAAALKAKRVPFVLATGYANALQPELQGAPCVAKPVNHDQLLQTLAQVLSA
jgi:CheY-like chemotaxis protein